MQVPRRGPESRKHLIKPAKLVGAPILRIRASHMMLCSSGSRAAGVPEDQGVIYDALCPKFEKSRKTVLRTGPSPTTTVPVRSVVGHAPAAAGARAPLP